MPCITSGLRLGGLALPTLSQVSIFFANDKSSFLSFSSSKVGVSSIFLLGVRCSCRNLPTSNTSQQKPVGAETIIQVPSSSKKGPPTNPLRFYIARPRGPLSSAAISISEWSEMHRRILGEAVRVRRSFLRDTISHHIYHSNLEHAEKALCSEPCPKSSLFSCLSFHKVVNVPQLPDSRYLHFCFKESQV